MKITMLGTSGSGKTVYMSAMSELFFNSAINGYSISNREDESQENNYNNATFVNRGFDKINSLYRYGKFPDGTSSSIVMPLELRYKGKKVINVDWIDYRGGALKELANGIQNERNAEIFATLLASDVILVFVDSAILKVSKNQFATRSLVGANEISQLLSMVTSKKQIDVVFILSKADSSIIDIKEDYNKLKETIGCIYSKFLTENNKEIADYPVIPVGAIGCGNVDTSYEWKDTNTGKALIFNNKISSFETMAPFNVAASFATALLKCLSSKQNALSSEVDAVVSELDALQKKFGVVKNLIDLLFNGSKKREHIYDLKRIIMDNETEIRLLKEHKERLEKIIESNS